MPIFDTPGPFPQTGNYDECVPEVSSGDVGTGTYYPLGPLSVTEAAHAVWVLRKLGVSFTLESPDGGLTGDPSPAGGSGSGEQSMRPGSGSPYADGQEVELIKGEGNILTEDGASTTDPYAYGEIIVGAGAAYLNPALAAPVVRIGTAYYVMLYVEAYIFFVDPDPFGSSGFIRLWSTIPDDPSDQISPVTCTAFGQSIDFYEPLGATGDSGSVVIDPSEYWSYNGKWNTSTGALN